MIDVEFVGTVKRDYVFRVRETRPRWWLFGPPVVVWQDDYRGDCTIWHRVLDGKRAPSWLESALCDAWQVQKWRHS